MLIASISLRRMLVVALLMCAAATVRAQGAVDVKAISTANDGSVTIDASRLTSVISLDAAWRFRPSDDVRFAEPAFDDAQWPLMQPAQDQLLAKAHAPDVIGGRDWARLHLHILNANGAVGLSLASVRNNLPYAVFANGKQIAMTRGFGTQLPYFSRPTVVVLPNEPDVVVAIRFVDPDASLIHYFPIEVIKIGPSGAMNDALAREHYANFEENYLALIATGLLFFAFAPFSFALLLMQRRRTEYLWLGVFCVLLGSDVCLGSALYTGAIPALRSIAIAVQAIDALVAVACLEFVASLAEVRRKWIVRVVEAISVSWFPLFLLHLNVAMYVCVALAAMCQLVLVIVVLVQAVREGRKECGIVFIPLTFLPISILIATAQREWPDRFGRVWHGHFGGVGYSGIDLGSLLILAGAMAVVFFRFNQVTKHEEIAAAELEAAKTVQRLLIPAVQPVTPGFAVESAYLPARQVGGDFFLVLPGEIGSGDDSLLAVMGDVSGKGLQAAMVVSTIIGGLRMGLVREPAAVLKYLNRMLVGHISGFATCCAVLIQPDGRMTIANAGNPAPYAGGQEIPTLAGLPLGMIADLEYEETSYRLDAGNRMTFVSDGVVEATSAAKKELFGFERTQAISGEPASTIAEAACAFGVGAPQADDITVLTVCLA